MKRAVFLLALVAGIYILLFEFLLPVNYLLPKPSLLLDSLFILGSHYSFWSNLFFTVSCVYLPLLTAAHVIMLAGGYFAPWLSRLCGKLHFCRFSPLKYLPVAVMAVILAYWFQGSVVAEVLFIFLISLGLLSSGLKDIYSTAQYYDISAPTPEKREKILRRRAFRLVQSSAFGKSAAVHIIIWSCALFFEYLNKAGGLGAVLYYALNFRDLSVIVLSFIIISIAALIADIIIRLILRRIIYWENDSFDNEAFFIEPMKAVIGAEKAKLLMREMVKSGIQGSSNPQGSSNHQGSSNPQGNSNQNMSLLIPYGDAGQYFTRALFSMRTGDNNGKGIENPGDSGLQDVTIAYIPSRAISVPWLNVRENIEEVFDESRWKKGDEKFGIDYFIEQAGLRGYENHYPHIYSPGFRFRIVLARVLAVKPDIIIAVDPFKHMQAESGIQLLDLMVNAAAGHGIPVIFITDNIQRAVSVSERVVMLKMSPMEIAGEIILSEIEITDRSRAVLSGLGEMKLKSGFSIGL